MPARARFVLPGALLAAAAAALWSLAPTLTARTAAGPGNKTAFVIALDSTGNPIRDLAKEDWGVREDGQDRKVVDAKLATDPLTMVVLVDITKWTQSSIKDVRSALGKFLDAIYAGAPDASISIVGFGSQTNTLVDFGKAAADVQKAGQRLFPDQSEDTVLLEALVDASKKLAKAPSPRRVIVSIGLEGFPETSTTPPQNVANAVLASTASYWAVSYRNADSNKIKGAAGQNRDVILNALPRQTGGFFFRVATPNAIEAITNRIAQALLAQYAVTYTRPDGPDPKLLQMAVARPGAQMLVPSTPPQ